MALTTYAEIKEQILDALDELKETAYPEDYLHELADSSTPIYNQDIIKEWSEMPSDYENRWQDYAQDPNILNGGIVKLMTIDLLFYYQELFYQVWQEVKEEQEIEQ